MKIRSALYRRSNMFEKILTACRNILQSDQIAADARAYLDSRLSKEAQIRYGFGFFPPNDELDRLTGLVDSDSLLSTRLMFMKQISGCNVKHGHFNNHNLVMPFRDVRNNIVSIVGRTLMSADNQKINGVSKYKYTFGSNKQLYLYGIDRAKDAIIKSNYVICVEGQFDCISCNEAGIKNVVACGGSNLLPLQFFLLRRYTNNLVVLLDNDDAGKTASNRLKKRYSPYAHIGIMTPPDGFKDIDEFLRNSDPKRRDEVIHVLKNLHHQINSKKGVLV